MVANNNVIETHALSFSYGKQRVLNAIGLQVPTGSIFGFLGPNGAGKSTAIKTLLGLLRTDYGMIRIFGKDLSTNKMDILNRIGAMVETPSLYDHLNAFRNLEITARLRNVPSDRIKPLLETVSLIHDAHKPVKQYSTGMKQRLSLAIAMLSNPELLILDEPINGLDPNGILEIRLLLARINKEHNCTILLSSHILTEIEKLCSDIAIINSGSLTFQGSMQSLLNEAGGKKVFQIQVNDPEKARIVLDGQLRPTVTKNRVLVTLNSEKEAANVIRLLVEGGVDIYLAEMQSTGLEASFLHMLNENHEL